MSETSQGTGWWLASDGRWYAPELRPAARPLEVPDADRVSFLCPNGHTVQGTPFCPLCGAEVPRPNVSEIEEAEDESPSVVLHDFGTGDGPVPSHQHPRGGGWVADTATVEASAFVGPNAAVFDRAQVLGSASVDGTAWVLGDAIVSGRSKIRGDSEVSGRAKVKGVALVTGTALVTDDASVSELAVVSGNARIVGEAVVAGETKIDGSDKGVGARTGAGKGQRAWVPLPTSVQEVGTSGLAIASLVLGILWLAGLGSLLALVFGYISRRDIRRSQGKVRGDGLAVAGIVLGWVGTVSLLLIVGLVVVATINSGDQITVDGQPVKLSIHSFSDPGTDQSGYNTDGSNDHFAIVEVEGTDQGSSSLSSTLPLSAIAYGQHGAVYEATNTTSTGDALCGSGNMSNLSPGETLYYCFGFVLPESDTVARIEVSVDQQYGVGSESWDVSDSFHGWSG